MPQLSQGSALGSTLFLLLINDLELDLLDPINVRNFPDDIVITLSVNEKQHFIRALNTSMYDFQIPLIYFAGEKINQLEIVRILCFPKNRKSSHKGICI